MPQDSGLDQKEMAKIAAAAQRMMEEVKSDPIPDGILTLARQLEKALAHQREQATAEPESEA